MKRSIAATTAAASSGEAPGATMRNWGRRFTRGRLAPAGSPRGGGPGRAWGPSGVGGPDAVAPSSARPWTEAGWLRIDEELQLLADAHRSPHRLLVGAGRERQRLAAGEREEQRNRVGDGARSHLRSAETAAREGEPRPPRRAADATARITDNGTVYSLPAGLPGRHEHAGLERGRRRGEGPTAGEGSTAGQGDGGPDARLLGSGGRARVIARTAGRLPPARS
jgi:hypothetical protein